MFDDIIHHTNFRTTKEYYYGQMKFAKSAHKQAADTKKNYINDHCKRQHLVEKRKEKKIKVEKELKRWKKVPRLNQNRTM